MKYPAVLERIRDRVLSERPQILADGGTNAGDLDVIVRATMYTLGFQITPDNDVVTTAPSRMETVPWLAPGSNVNRRFGGRRKR